MELERYEKWEPVEGITTPAGFAFINEDYDGLTVILIFSEILGTVFDKDLRIHFGHVPAYTVHEEFVHPWNMYDAEPYPRLEGGRFTFPLLIVKNSVWQRSFTEHQLTHFRDSIHYRFVTLEETVDVLCNNLPEASWIEPLS